MAEVVQTSESGYSFQYPKLPCPMEFRYVVVDLDQADVLRIRERNVVAGSCASFESDSRQSVG